MSSEFGRSDEPRRRHKRFTPPRSEVILIPRGFWSSVVFKKNVALRLKDVSLGGVQVVLGRELRPGVKADLTIKFPGFPRPVAAEADIRWCRRDTISLEPRWNAGLTFKRLSPNDEAHLREVDRTFLG